MGNCTYCGQPAGFMRGQHPACQAQHNDALRQIAELASTSFRAKALSASLQTQVQSMATTGKVAMDQTRITLSQVWSRAVEDYLQDGIIDAGEEQQLLAFQQLFGLTQQELDKNGSYTRVAQAAVLRDLTAGKLPQRVAISGGLPVNLQKNESVVWAFRNVEMLEDRTRREYVGRNHGVSIRVMKGVYYRTGTFKGTPVEKTERVSVDTGMLIVTDKNLYFAGPSKSLRLPYGKIVAFHPYSNGVGVMQDGEKAKAKVFVTGDGWFPYNLLTNLAANA